MNAEELSRRMVLRGLGAAAVPLALGAGCTRTEEASRLPAEETGLFRPTFLEHLGTVLPDVAGAARFHSRLFNPALMTEREPVPLRLYVNLTPGYLAFGSRRDESRAFFDHFCILLADWDRAAVAAALAAQGFTPNPEFMLIQDPDRIGVQFYGHPGGWFPTVIPAEPLVEGPSLVTPMGLEHVMLRVTDVAASVAFYRRFFGPLDREPRGDTVWFEFADTRLGLQRAAEGTTPVIDHIRVRAAPYDRAALAANLTEMGAQSVMPDADDARVLRFTDPAGLKLELMAVG